MSTPALTRHWPPALRRNVTVLCVAALLTAGIFLATFLGDLLALLSVTLLATYLLLDWVNALEALAKRLLPAGWRQQRLPVWLARLPMPGITHRLLAVFTAMLAFLALLALTARMVLPVISQEVGGFLQALPGYYHTLDKQLDALGNAQWGDRVIQRLLTLPQGSTAPGAPGGPMTLLLPALPGPKTSQTPSPVPAMTAPLPVPLSVPLHAPSPASSAPGASEAAPASADADPGVSQAPVESPQEPPEALDISAQAPDPVDTRAVEEPAPLPAPLRPNPDRTLEPVSMPASAPPVASPVTPVTANPASPSTGKSGESARDAASGGPGEWPVASPDTPRLGETGPGTVVIAQPLAPPVAPRQTALEQLLGVFRRFVSTPGAINIMDLLGASLTGLVYTLTGLALLFYFLMDGPRLVAGTLRLVPQASRPQAEALLGQVHRLFLGLVRLQALSALVTGVLLYGCYAYVLHIPYAGFLSAFFGVSALFPGMGPWLGALPSALALLMDGHWLSLVVTLSSLGGFYLFRQRWAFPRLGAGHEAIHPVVSILAQLVCIRLLGTVAGLLAALPLSCLLMALWGTCFGTRARRPA